MHKIPCLDGEKNSVKKVAIEAVNNAISKPFKISSSI